MKQCSCLDKSRAKLNIQREYKIYDVLPCLFRVTTDEEKLQRQLDSPSDRGPSYSILNNCSMDFWDKCDIIFAKALSRVKMSDDKTTACRRFCQMTDS